MRVISGSLKGRQLSSPKGRRTHPMGDKIRSAIFSILGDIDGLTVLDAFAGSGALSIEAISRGAASVLAIDIDLQAAKIAQQNVDATHLNGQIKIVRANAGQWSLAHSDQFYDIVILDPPYDAVRPDLLQQLATHVSQNDGTLVLSVPKGYENVEFSALTLIVEKNYGDATIRFYKRV